MKSKTENVNIDIFEWLEGWYVRNWQRGWCHSKGFHIGTIDNPGWFIKFNLIGTDLEGKELSPVNIDRSEHDWVHCMTKNHEFQAAGGTNNLIEMLQIFINWAMGKLVTLKNLKTLEWLQKWLENNCDEDWEHLFGIEIQTTTSLSWKVNIDIEETTLHGKVLQPMFIRSTEDDWLKYEINKKRYQAFQGTCGHMNLKELLEVFINWADANSS